MPAVSWEAHGAAGAPTRRRWRGTLAERVAVGAPDPLLAAILAVTLLLSVYHLDWGLPDGGQSAWAADAYGPLKVLGIVYRSFREWDSGWFYFKHPLGYPLVLAAAYAPYLGFLRLAGLWRHPLPHYPYGFADPESALFTLAMIGRLLSVAFTVGTVALTYGIGRRLAGRNAARLAAWFVATAYPFVYYAHTTNLDAAYVFWLSLALYAAIRAGESGRRAPWIWLGFAIAMGVATKEQGFGFLLPLPLLALISRIRATGSLRPCWRGPIWWMAGTVLVTVPLANNAIYNPLGFIRRIAFMLGRPLEPVSRALLPVEFAWFKGAQELKYLQQVWDGLDSAFGTLLAVAVLIGAVAMWRRLRLALWLFLPAVSLHYFGLRGMVISPNESTLVVTIRYLMPIMVVAAVAAATWLTQLRLPARSRGIRWAGAVVVLLLAGIGLARALELDLLLRSDTRYHAERWMRANVAHGATIEVYQDRAHLPRFAPEWTVTKVPIAGRSIAGVETRDPSFIVLSSASTGSIAHVRTADWRATRSWLSGVEPAVQFHQALTTGALRYRRVAEFSRRPRLFRSKITSLSPTITIYAREGVEAPPPRAAELGALKPAAGRRDRQA